MSPYIFISIFNLLNICDNAMHFSDWIIIRMIRMITPFIIAISLPIAEGKSEGWIHSLITGDCVNRRTPFPKISSFITPQHLAAPQYIEGLLIQS
jgi:hypothetical protein